LTQNNLSEGRDNGAHRPPSTGFVRDRYCEFCRQVGRR
jgi:hypothetical protein